MSYQTQRWYDPKAEAEHKLRWKLEKRNEWEASRLKLEAEIVALEARLTQPFEPGKFVTETHLSLAEVVGIWEGVIARSTAGSASVLEKYMK